MLILGAGPAWAQSIPQTMGGNGGAGTNGTGGTGGESNPTGTGEAGGDGTLPTGQNGGGGGGGGAGISGGAGAGGAGGGSNAGTGGRSGAHGQEVTSPSTNSTTVTGGAGAGGANAGGSGGGGGGGAGGYGVVVNGGGITFTNEGTITGGGGGVGGSGHSNGSGGGGGDGGYGVFLNSSGDTLINNGTITGGVGGAGAGTGAPGAGGAGIIGDTLAIVNAGTISGGFAGNGGPRANAITFTGGTNSLELQAGFVINGNVVGQNGSTNTLILGGGANDKFDASQLAPAGSTAGQYQGFSAFEKTGTSTWTLTGTNTFDGTTTVDGGKLLAGGVGAFSADSATTINTGGTLDLGGFRQTIDTVMLAGGTVQDGQLTGAITSTGGTVNGIGGTATLTTTEGITTMLGTNTYNGLTTIEGGTLLAGGVGAFSAVSATTINTGGTLDLGDFRQTIDTVMLAGGTVQDGQLTGAITSTGGTVNGIGGTATLTTTEGITTMLGTNTYNGLTTIEGGTLAAGGENVFSAASHTIVESGGTLALQSFNQTLNNGLENEGTVQFPAILGNGVSGSNPGTTLTVNNYSGTGILAINTFLGTDSSPSDKLIVNGGMATGSTSIDVHNVGGLGAETTGTGIEVVATERGGMTAANAFFLDHEVRGGAFTYDLVRIGQDWFLQSMTAETEPPGPEEVPEVPPEVEVPGTEFPTEPPPGTLPPEVVFPDIGPELATYGVVQPIAREMGLTTLGTLQQRIGDAAADACWGAATTCCAASNGSLVTKAPPAYTKAPPVQDCRPAVWGRFFGQQVNNHYQAFGDPRASGWMGGFQGGVDLFRGSLWGLGADVAGLYFSYDTSTIDVSGLVTNPEATAFILTHTGKLGLTAYSAGGYWTHYGPTGWYLDAVLQGSWYTGGAFTQNASLPTRGTGFISSLEGGYPIPLPVFGPGFVLEPQAQIIWQQVAFDTANDGLGPVDLGTTSGATGRLGLRGKWTIVGENGQLWQPYVRANVWRDWDAQATTTFGIDQVPLNEQATRLEFAGGLTTKIDPHLSFYGQAGYQFAVSQTTAGAERNAVMGDIGVRYQW